MSSERTGEGWKHFSREESAVLSLAGDAEDKKVEGYLQIFLLLSGPLRSPSCRPSKEQSGDKLDVIEGTSARSLCNWGSVAQLRSVPCGVFSTFLDTQMLLSGAAGERRYK